MSRNLIQIGLGCFFCTFTSSKSELARISKQKFVIGFDKSARSEAAESVQVYFRSGLPKLFRSRPLLIFQNFSRPFTTKITNSAKYAFVIIIKRRKLKTSYRYSIIYLFYFCGIFILLSRESNQCAIRARSGVASHLFTTPTWGNPAKCLSHRHNK